MTAYESYDELEMMIDLELDQRLPEIAPNTLPLKKVVYELIKYFQRRGKLFELIQGAHEDNSGNENLKHIYNEFALLSPNDNKILSEDELKKLRLIVNSIAKSSLGLNFLQELCRKTIGRLTKYPSDQMANANTSNSIIEILLKSYPLRNDNIPTIFEFAQRIYDYDLEGKDKLPKDEIKQWLKDVKYIRDREEITLPIDYPKPQKKVTSHNQFISQYIAIVVHEIEPEPDKQFSLSVTRFYGDKADDLDFLDVGENNCFSETELRDKIISLINELPERIYEKYNSYVENTIIELFIPYEIIKNNHDIDLEIIEKKGLQKEPLTLGEKYCLIIRIRERYAKEYYPYGYKQKLDDRWQALQNFNKEEFIEKIENLECIDCNKKDFIKFWKQLLLDWNRHKKIAVNLTGSLSQQNTKSVDALFSHIIEGGVPIALWNRNPKLSSDYVKGEFNNLINQDSLKDLNLLYEKIHKTRQDAVIADVPEQHIGSCLGFLCDHTFRVPSSINDDILIPTGQ